MGKIIMKQGKYYYIFEPNKTGSRLISKWTTDEILPDTIRRHYLLEGDQLFRVDIKLLKSKRGNRWHKSPIKNK